MKELQLTHTHTLSSATSAFAPRLCAIRNVVTSLLVMPTAFDGSGNPDARSGDYIIVVRQSYDDVTTGNLVLYRTQPDKTFGYVEYMYDLLNIYNIFIYIYIDFVLVDPDPFVGLQRYQLPQKISQQFLQ